MSSLIEEKEIAVELGGGRENAKHSEQVHPKRLVQEDDIFKRSSISNSYSNFSNNI
jgi:hypothetical protein